VTKRDNLRGAISAIGLGIAAIGLGCKGFTPKGLPWTKSRNITGKPAEFVGVGCMIIGAAFICFGLVILSEDHF
jgi:hypothetical protein